MATTPPRLSVFARWRPLVDDESDTAELERATIIHPTPTRLLSLSIGQPTLEKQTTKQWKSAPAFRQVLEGQDDNATAYATIVKPLIPQVMEGGSCSFFAYGHSGSGKTYSIVGYDYEDDKQLGLCLAAAKCLFVDLKRLNERKEATKLGVAFSLFELRGKKAFDLLAGSKECYIREGPDGKVHIRGQTETLEDGKVRVQPIVKLSCWDYESLRKELQGAFSLRAVGSSSVHEQSSRTHAVLELEIINQELVDARQAVIERQSELVPVGKYATDVYIEECRKSIIDKPGGGYQQNPNYDKDQARIDDAEAKKAAHEVRVSQAEQQVESLVASSRFACIGGKMVFVDLAGAEYQTDTSGPSRVRQSPTEIQEGRQINTDLLALKEVMRAWSRGQPRIPFRSSPLTMVLREHFMSSKQNSSSMIVTVSPAQGHYAATLNSLKYASLVGAAMAYIS